MIPVLILRVEIILQTLIDGDFRILNIQLIDLRKITGIHMIDRL